MARAKATIDHKTIRQWVEARDGCPAHIKGTGSNGDVGMLRIDYTGFKGQRSLEKVSWQAFFEAFEENQLAFSEPQFMSKVVVLKEVIKHYVKEEEQELFVKVREQAVDDLEMLGERMLHAYKQLMKQHPSSAVPKETRAAAEL